MKKNTGAGQKRTGSATLVGEAHLGLAETAITPAILSIFSVLGRLTKIKKWHDMAQN